LAPDLNGLKFEQLKTKPPVFIQRSYALVRKSRIPVFVYPMYYVFRVTVLYLAVSNWPIPHSVMVGHTRLTHIGGDSETDDFSHETYVPIINYYQCHELLNIINK